MEIPLDALDPDTLRAIVEEFVSREGTDYGHADHPLEEKIAAVLGQLRRGEARVVFDPDTESVNILSTTSGS